MSDAEAAAAPSSFAAHMDALGDDAPDFTGARTGATDSDSSPARNQMLEPRAKPRASAKRADAEDDAEEGVLTVDPEDDDGPRGDEAEEETLDDSEEDQEEPDEPEEEDRRGAPTKAQLMEMFKALSSSTLPEQLLDRTLSVSDGEREYNVTIDEMRKGYMRAKNFSRGKSEQAQMIREARNMMDGVRSNFQTWKQNPDALVSSMRELIGDDAFDKAVELRATQIYQMKHMPPEKREMLMEIEKARALARQREMELQQVRQAQQPDPQQQLEQVTQFVHQSVPQLFQRHGISLVDPAIHAFARNFQPLWNGQPDTIQRAMEEAAVATVQELRDNAEEYWQAHSAQQDPRRAKTLKRNLQQQRLGTRPMPGASPKVSDKVSRGTRKGGGSPSDFARMRERFGNG